MERIEDQLILNSDIQKNNLPIKVSYHSMDKSDKDVKKINFIKDLKGNPVDYAFVYINDDSTSCMDGDLLCTKEFKTIDSIKVRFENYGISSKWITVEPFDGVIQITIQTYKNLRNYIVLNNRKYKIYKTKIVEVKQTTEAK
jgi:hypothetical protein